MKKNDLGRDSINKLLISFSIPCVISMLINSIYNIVDQIFIGKGVGTFGNGATNVIFPLIIIFNALAGLVGNGASANMSLRLGEGNDKEAAKGVGQTIVLIFIIAIVSSLLAFILLPRLVYLFGCTDNVYRYAIDYGRIIILGAPFMMIYSSLSNLIRSDGSPKYSMYMLIGGAIINLILDPIFIFGFNMGVKGGAWATVIGQFITFLFAIIYLRRMKSITLDKDCFKLDKNIFKILSLGMSSFITQLTVLVLFVYMNNVLTKLGVNSKFGADIPLSVYGVMSKVNSLFISTVLGVSIGAQPIVGFNYGSGKMLRVKETIKKVIIINLSVGIIFNIIFVLFPSQLAGLFIAKSDINYSLFIEFAKLFSRSFLVVMFLNAFEISGSILIQALGKVGKATSLSFVRQIILFIPISLLLAYNFKLGIKGVLYSGCIADLLCFLVAIFVIGSEYVKLKEDDSDIDNVISNNYVNYHDKKIVITIAREYASGGRYVGKLLADRLNIKFYDKDILSLVANESGFSKKYVLEHDEAKRKNSNNDSLFIASSKVIKKIAKNESCVIVGRCADYILRNQSNVIRVFLYNDMDNKIKRAVKYYGIDKDRVVNTIRRINKSREKYYKFYTGKNWRDMNNYDICIDVDKYGIDKTVDIIINLIK